MIRRQMGRQNQTFNFCVSLLEPLNRDISELLAHHGIHNNMIPPWLITPWLLEHENPTRHGKNRVLERLASSVIQSWSTGE